MNAVFAYITCPDRANAKNISVHLLKKKLAACTNIFPIDSTYHWKGKIVNEKEFALIAKTSESVFEKLKREVELIHPYKVPCIIKIPVKPNEKYSEWMKSQLKS